MSHDMLPARGEFNVIFLTCPFGILQGQGATRKKKEKKSASLVLN